MILPPSHFCQAILVGFIKILLSRKASSAALTFVTLSEALKARSRTGLRRASRAIFYFASLFYPPPPAFLSSEINCFFRNFYFHFLPTCCLNKNSGIAAEISPLHISFCLFSSFLSSINFNLSISKVFFRSK